MRLICCVPACTASVLVPRTARLGWIPAICGYGHSCWVVRAVGKTVIMRRQEDPAIDPASEFHANTH